MSRDPAYSEDLSEPAVAPEDAAADPTVRAVLEVIQNADPVARAWLWVRDGDVAGFVEIRNKVLTSAYIIGTHEHGLRALRRLLSLSSAEYKFSTEVVPGETPDPFNIPIQALLEWREEGNSEAVPEIAQALLNVSIRVRRSTDSGWDTEEDSGWGDGDWEDDASAAADALCESSDSADGQIRGPEGGQPIQSHPRSPVGSNAASQAPVEESDSATLAEQCGQPEETDIGGQQSGSHEEPDTDKVASPPLTLDPTLIPAMPRSGVIPPMPRFAQARDTRSTAQKLKAIVHDIERARSGYVAPKFEEASLAAEPVVADDTIDGLLVPRRAESTGTTEAPHAIPNTAREAVAGSQTTSPERPQVERRQAERSGLASTLSTTKSGAVRLSSSTTDSVKPFCKRDQPKADEGTADVRNLRQKEEPVAEVSPEETKWAMQSLIILATVGVTAALVLGLWFTVKDSEAKSHGDLGRRYFAKKNYQMAIAEFDKIFESGAADDQIYFYRGLAKMHLGNYETAIDDLTEAIKRNSTRQDYLAGRAAAYLRAGKYPEAVKDSSDAIKYASDRTYRLLASTRAEMGQDGLTPEQRTIANSLRVRAVANSKLGDYSAALSDCKEWQKVREGFRQSDVSATMGYALHKLGRFQEAIEAYNEALELSPGNSDYLASRAATWKELKQFDKAIVDCNLAMKQTPNDSDLLWLRGTCYESMGNMSAAEADLAKCCKLRRAPKFLAAYGDFFMATGRYERAINYYDEVLSMKSADNETAAKRLEAYAKLRRKAPNLVLAKSVDSRQNDIGASPKMDSLVDKGYAALQSGRADEAIELFSDAVAADPKDVKARRYLAKVLEATGDRAGAAGQYLYLKSTGNATVEDHLALGRLYAAAGRTEDSIRAFGDLLTKDPNSDSARVSMIEAYTLLGRTAQASELCKEGLHRAKTQELKDKYSTLLETIKSQKPLQPKAPHPPVDVGPTQ